MIPEQLLEEVASLEKAGYQIQLFEAGSRVYIIFKGFELPSGYNVDKTDLLVFTTTAYPNVAFDMFWVDRSVLLLGNKVPKAANHIEMHLNVNWRRFSIHPYQHKTWDPIEDSLEGYLSYITNRLNSLV